MFKKLILKIESSIAWSQTKLTNKQFIFLSSVLVGISAAFAVILLKSFGHKVFSIATSVNGILKFSFINSNLHNSSIDFKYNLLCWKYCRNMYKFKNSSFSNSKFGVFETKFKEKYYRGSHLLF